MAKTDITPFLIGAAVIGGGYLLWRSKSPDTGGKEGTVFVPAFPGAPAGQRVPAPYVVTMQELNDAMPSTSEYGQWWASIERGANTNASRSYRWAILPLRAKTPQGDTHVVVFVGESDNANVAEHFPVTGRVEAMDEIQERIDSL